MADRPLKSTAKPWPQATRPDQRYRDRKRVKQPDGSYKEFVGYGRTKAEATRSLYDRIHTHEAQLRTAATAPTMTQLMAQLLLHKRTIRGRKRATIHSNAGLFRRYIQPTIGSTPVDQVTLSDLQAIQYQLLEAKHYRTAEMVTILLRSLFRHALRTYGAEIRAGRLVLHDLGADLEAVTRPPEARTRAPDPWTAEQLADFLAAARAKYDRSRSNLLYPVFHTAVAAGLRRGELLGLRRQDLVTTGTDEGPWWLQVNQQLVYLQGQHRTETPKTAAGERRVPIGPELAKVLHAHMAKVDKVAEANPKWAATDLLFPSYNGQPLEPGNLYRAMRQIIDELGLPRIRLHEMRSLYATYLTRELVRQGRYSPKLVMQVLGHTHPHVALQHYTRVVEEDLLVATFDPVPERSVDKSVDKAANEEDALPVESAS